MGKHIIIKEARCSFPQLYSKQLNDGQEFNPGITLVLEAKKHADKIAEVKAAINATINNNPKLKKAKENEKLGPDRLCLRKATDDQTKYLEGNIILKAGNPRPPLVLFPDGKTTMHEDNNAIYSGCYVNAKIEIWGQDNNYGKRINAKLIAVQFVPKEAESFDSSYVSPGVAAEGFGSLDSDTFLNADGGENEEEDLLG